MFTGPSVESVILDKLLAGEMSLDYVREMYRQRELFQKRAKEYIARFPGKCLAMVAGTLLVEEQYLLLIDRLRREYAGKPFFLYQPEDIERAMVGKSTFAEGGGL